MKHISTLLIFTCCFFLTYHSVAQTDTIYNINPITVMLIKDNQKFLIKYDTSPYMKSMSSITYYHYDSLDYPIKDSAIYDKMGITEHFHSVDGETKLKYTYYHDKDINVSYTETRNDSVVVINVVRFKEKDTVVQSDTIFLYYPDYKSVDGLCINITLEALGEKIYYSDTFDNRMRIFRSEFGNDTMDFVVLYTISDIFKKSLQVTRKTGEYLCHSIFESKEDIMKGYIYESTQKTLSKKKINKVLKKITSFNKSITSSYFITGVVVEYVMNGKNYYITYPFDISDFRAGGDPELREEEKMWELVKKLVTYLDDCFR